MISKSRECITFDHVASGESISSINREMTCNDNNIYKLSEIVAEMSRYFLLIEFQGCRFSVAIYDYKLLKITEVITT